MSKKPGNSFYSLTDDQVKSENPYSLTDDNVTRQATAARSAVAPQAESNYMSPSSTSKAPHAILKKALNDFISESEKISKNPNSPESVKAIMFLQKALLTISKSSNADIQELDEFGESLLQILDSKILRVLPEIPLLKTQLDNFKAEMKERGVSDNAIYAQPRATYSGPRSAGLAQTQASAQASNSEQSRSATMQPTLSFKQKARAFDSKPSDIASLTDISLDDSSTDDGIEEQAPIPQSDYKRRPSQADNASLSSSGSRDSGTGSTFAEKRAAERKGSMQFGSHTERVLEEQATGGRTTLEDQLKKGPTTFDPSTLLKRKEGPDHTGRS